MQATYNALHRRSIVPVLPFLDAQASHEGKALHRCCATKANAGSYRPCATGLALVLCKQGQMQAWWSLSMYACLHYLSFCSSTYPPISMMCHTRPHAGTVLSWQCRSPGRCQARRRLCWCTGSWQSKHIAAQALAIHELHTWPSRQVHSSCQMCDRRTYNMYVTAARAVHGASRGGFVQGGCMCEGQSTHARMCLYVCVWPCTTCADLHNACWLAQHVWACTTCVGLHNMSGGTLMRSDVCEGACVHKAPNRWTNRARADTHTPAWCSLDSPFSSVRSCLVKCVGKPQLLMTWFHAVTRKQDSSDTHTS